MGVSTNGQLCYGVLFEEGFEFPWDEYDDIEDWWAKVKGFTPTVYPYNSEGDYAEGINAKSPEIDIYHNEKSEWEKANPIPVELVNYCSCDYPMYILTVPSANYYNSRGDAVGIDPTKLLDEQGEAHDILIQFLKEFEIEYEDEPCWLLSSLWC